ncbi:MAG: LytR C-terminal domain-containing protein [Acidimicrobiales bacterium]
MTSPARTPPGFRERLRRRWSQQHRPMVLFTGAELILTLAVPFLAVAGYHALLQSRAGTFVQEVAADEPGWRAAVSPSPVTAVVEMADDRITGISVLAAHPSSTDGGAVILVPGDLMVDGQPLADRLPRDAVGALSRSIRLGIPTVEVVDEARWPVVMGGGVYTVANPDEVVDDDMVVFDSGEVEVDGADAAAFLGQVTDGANPITVMYRRRLLWSAMLADPPSGDDPAAASIAAVAGSAARVVDIPLATLEPSPVADPEAVEALIRDMVPAPAGAAPGDRLRVRLIDRTGQADLVAVAARLAATGVEVVEIGNAGVFDNGPGEIVVPQGIDDPAINELASLLGASTVRSNDVEGDGVITVFIGPDSTID